MSDSSKKEDTVILAEDEGNEAAVRSLLHALACGDTELLNKSLLDLGVRSPHQLYNEVGEMARLLHNSLREFQKSLDPASVTMSSTNIPDAASKLESVIELTFDAAHKTLDLTERQGKLIDDGLSCLGEIISELDEETQEKASQISPLTKSLKEQEERLRESQAINAEILMAQEFQDLTGQALRKVIKLVTDLEGHLVNLVQVFGKQVSLDDDQPENQDTIDPEAKIDQKEADDILASFGF